MAAAVDLRPRALVEGLGTALLLATAIGSGIMSDKTRARMRRLRGCPRYFTSESDPAARVSMAQAESELRLAGFDVKRERAEANAWLKELTGEGDRDAPKDDATDADAGEPAAWVSGPPPASHPASATRWTLLVTAALAAAATAGGCDLRRGASA